MQLCGVKASVSNEFGENDRCFVGVAADVSEVDLVLLVGLGLLVIQYLLVGSLYPLSLVLLGRLM